MSALTKLTKVEAKIFARDPMALLWSVLFPAALLFVLGSFFPGAQEPNADLGGVRLVDLYAPIVLALALATVAFATLPAVLATYRERGILRKLSTTPVHPGRLVIAQLLVHLVAATIAAALAIAVGVIVFDIPVPVNLVGFSFAFLLAAASMLAVGLLIGAVAPTLSAGQGIGLAVYFPMLFFAGIYFPREGMSDRLRMVSDLTPAGAAVQAFNDTWSGLAPSTSSLLVMAAFTVGAGLLATRLFRWE
jgi:ABC-2 type transport system permease protein